MEVFKSQFERGAEAAATGSSAQDEGNPWDRRGREAARGCGARREARKGRAEGWEAEVRKGIALDHLIRKEWGGLLQDGSLHVRWGTRGDQGIGTVSRGARMKCWCTIK